jgi:L-aspartate oxidase
MWTHAGLERSGDGLRLAQETLERWAPGGDTIAELEKRNLLELARVVVSAASRREESRGAHYRVDFPGPRAEYATSLQSTAPARATALEAAL